MEDDVGRIELKHVYKDYMPGSHVVDDLNLTIEEGEFIVLVGPSGCGKSTTLRMIAGLEDITSGEITFDGQVINEVEPKDRDIAMVFQNYALYPHMNVAENMGFGLKMKKVDKSTIDKRVEETANIIGLEDYLDRLPKDLSGGQRQRVALGRAISRKPKVFLMDEPLSNLDAKLRVQTRSEITKISKKFKNTTIYVTHDQVEAMTMADRIVLMKDGIVQQVSTPREIYLKPNNKFVASFIGSPAMNFLDARVDGYLFVGDRKINLPEKVLNALKEKGYDRKEITFGIRPEHIYIKKDGVESDHQLISFRVELELAELLGSETLLHFNIDGQNMISKVHSLDVFNSGDDIEFYIDSEFIYFFDKETEEVINLDLEV